MRKAAAVFFIFLFGLFQSQDVTFNKIETVHQNSDRFLYRLDNVSADAVYLGEIEVHGYSADDAAVFGKVYKKAKEIGANGFRYKPFENIEGNLSKFDVNNYKISLYYLPADKFPKENNMAYLFSASDRPQTIAVNNSRIEIMPRSYRVIKMLPGQVYHISTRKLLGSSINLSPKENQPEQYFLVSAMKINSGNENSPGLKIKSGDIIGLEKSYAQFLTMIYTKSE